MPSGPIGRGGLSRVYHISRTDGVLSTRRPFATGYGPLLPEERNHWLATHVLPHEGDVRRWLRRFSGIEIDDIIQQAWVELAEADPASIRFPRAWFFGVARHLVLQHYRKARIVSFDSLTDFSGAEIPDLGQAVERSVTARQELRFLDQVARDLPDRCRDVFVLRRFYGYSQRECALHLNVSENVVEKQLARALRIIGTAYAGRDLPAQGGGSASGDLRSGKSNA
ncbi:RNA polymerase sigma factor [Gluconacetobacter sp.]|uniref:RNA polymerase sigma factor n=1 Tax=Gluconacetobacter sp. TaxID=1935994 RepID=UPI0039EA527A